MKCQSLFSGKNKKNINFSSAEFAQSVVKLSNGRVTLLKRIYGHKCVNEAPVTTAADELNYLLFLKGNITLTGVMH